MVILKPVLHRIQHIKGKNSNHIIHVGGIDLPGIVSACVGIKVPAEVWATLWFSATQSSIVKYTCAVSGGRRGLDWAPPRAALNVTYQERCAVLLQLTSTS